MPSRDFYEAQTTPGTRFAGQPPWVPYFWEIATLAGLDTEERIELAVQASDLLMFPELRGFEQVVLKRIPGAILGEARRVNPSPKHVPLAAVATTLRTWVPRAHAVQILLDLGADMETVECLCPETSDDIKVKAELAKEPARGQP